MRQCPSLPVVSWLDEPRTFLLRPLVFLRLVVLVALHLPLVASTAQSESVSRSGRAFSRMNSEKVGFCECQEQHCHASSFFCARWTVSDLSNKGFISCLFNLPFRLSRFPCVSDPNCVKMSVVQADHTCLQQSLLYSRSSASRASKN